MINHLRDLPAAVVALTIVKKIQYILFFLKIQYYVKDVHIVYKILKTEKHTSHNTVIITTPVFNGIQPQQLFIFARAIFIM
jgi:hypothetical protein